MLTPGFGTENLVFVPEGATLTLVDAERARRYRINSRRCRVRLRPGACDALRGGVEAALEKLKSAPRYAASIIELAARANRMLGELEGSFAVPRGRLGKDPTIENALEASGLRCWLRLSDSPAESFFAEDYTEHEGPGESTTLSYLLPGSIHLEWLDRFELPLPASGLESAFALDLPEEDGLFTEALPPGEPLPLVDEFCGARGVSNRGFSVNLDSKARVASDHMGALPAMLLGDGLFATLYFHLRTQSPHEVTARLRGGLLDAATHRLTSSGYAVKEVAPGCSIFSSAQGNVLHLYRGLPGHESGGAFEMPTFLYAALAAGSPNPTHRAAMLEALIDSVSRAG